MSFEHIPSNFRFYIQKVFDAKLRIDSRFTLRAFAQELDISNQRLSRLLNGKLGLSLSESHKLAKKLALSRHDTEIFCALAEAAHGRSGAQRADAQERLAKLNRSYDFEEVSPEQFKDMLDWYYLPIFVLFSLREAKPSAAWVAKRLGIEIATAQAAIKNLFAAGYLKQDVSGQWYQATPYINLHAYQTTQDIRNFYRAMIHKGVESIETVDPKQRSMTASFLTVSSENYVYAQKRIDEFCTGLVKELGDFVPDDSRVYSLTTQFFPVDQLAVKETQSPHAIDNNDNNFGD